MSNATTSAHSTRARIADSAPDPKLNVNFTMRNWGGERAAADALGMSAKDMASAITVEAPSSGSDWSEDEEES